MPSTASSFRRGTPRPFAGRLAVELRRSGALLRPRQIRARCIGQGRQCVEHKIDGGNMFEAPRRREYPLPPLRDGRLCGMRADNFRAGPPLLVLDRSAAKKCANTAEPSPKSSLKPSAVACWIGRSCRCCQCRGSGRPTSCRPASRKPPIPPLLPPAPLRRSSPSPSVDQARARRYHGSPPGHAGGRRIIASPTGLLRGEMPAYELPRGPRPAGAASISRSL
jgi:hypothetical protein